MKQGSIVKNINYVEKVVFVKTKLNFYVHASEHKSVSWHFPHFKPICFQYISYQVGDDGEMSAVETIFLVRKNWLRELPLIINKTSNGLKLSPAIRFPRCWFQDDGKS